MEDGEECLKDSSILEEEYADLCEVVPQPMHVFVTTMEEIGDEDDLLEELDFLCSSIMGSWLHRKYARRLPVTRTPALTPLVTQ